VLLVVFGGWYLLKASKTQQSALPPAEEVMIEESTKSPEAMVDNEVSVTIENFAFGPSTLTIPKGTKVTWTNKDEPAHTVTSDTGSELDSELLAQGQSFSHVFNTVGTFAYHCTPHPNMKATVVVE
jgi:plastocyanin